MCLFNSPCSVQMHFSFFIRIPTFFRVSIFFNCSDFEPKIIFELFFNTKGVTLLKM